MKHINLKEKLSEVNASKFIEFERMLTEIEAECKKAGGNITLEELEKHSASDFLASMIMNGVSVSFKYKKRAK